ncbi:MAG: efflux RND transporter permease subunit [Leptospirales bacterium]
MTRLVAFFLDRPLVVKLVIFAVTVLGINSIVHMQKEGFPNITFKQVYITVIYPGAIVMVHTIKEKSKGILNHDAILNGAVGRLRPILLTTVTTILGVSPTAYGLGGMDPFISQMCLFLGYGLLFSTLIVLFLIPVLFMIGVNLNQRFAK